MVWICGLCAVIALAVGLFVFRRQQDKFVLHI
jgi:ABC-type polysaccharide/polyol phosphate export permease